MGSPTSIASPDWTLRICSSSSARPSRASGVRLVDAGYGGDEVLARAGFVQRLASQLDKRGTVDVLRHGVMDRKCEDPAGILQTR